VDAAFQGAKGITSVGSCIRNADCQFMMAQTLWKQSHRTILVGEAMVLMEEIRLAINKGRENVIF